MELEQFVIGIDGGTESLRAAVFDSTGKLPYTIAFIKFIHSYSNNDV